MHLKIDRERKPGFLPPIGLLLCAVALGIYLSRTDALFSVDCAFLALIVVGIGIGYFIGNRPGYIFTAGVYVLYVVLGVIAKWTLPVGWLFFLVWTPAVCACLIALRSRLETLRRERDYQRERCERETLIDASVDLRNLRSYQNDADIYLRIVRRYHLYLGLVLWQLENPEELLAALGEERFQELLRRISRTLNDSMRPEDMVFMLSETDREYVWATLHIANCSEADHVITQRVKPTLDATALPDGQKLCFSARSITTDGADISPMNLLERAKAVPKGTEN